MGRYSLLVPIVAVVLGLSLGYLVFLGISCPRPPYTLSAEWNYIGCSGGAAHYVVSSDPRCLVKTLGEYYGDVLYYAYISGDYPVDLNVSVERNGPAVLLIVPDYLSPVSYMIVSSGRFTHILISRTSVTKQTRSFSWSDRICPHLPFDVLTESEVVSREANEAVHYCYVQVNADFNSVFDYLLQNGAVIGTVLGRTYFHLDNNLVAYAVPTEENGITGLTFYRVVRREE